MVDIDKQNVVSTVQDSPWSGIFRMLSFYERMHVFSNVDHRSVNSLSKLQPRPFGNVLKWIKVNAPDATFAPQSAMSRQTAYTMPLMLTTMLRNGRWLHATQEWPVNSIAHYKSSTRVRAWRRRSPILSFMYAKSFLHGLSR